MHHQIHPNKIRQFFFLIVLIGLGLVIANEMFFMLGAFLGAVTLYVLMRNTMIKLIIDYKWKKPLAALALILLSFVVLVIPFIYMGTVLVEKISPIVQDPSLIESKFIQINNYLIEKTKFNILENFNFSAINGKVFAIGQKMLGGTLSAVGSIFIMYFMLYFLLVQTSDVELWLRRNVPFKHTNTNKVINEIKGSIYGNAIGIPLVAVAQGIVGIIGYLIFGVEEFFLMGILTAICSVIPVVGAMIIYLPLGLYELSQGHTWQGIGILIWGFVVIGGIDNIIRLVLQKRMGNVHPLITIFGVIIGVNMFGFLGVIFGPLILSIFTLLVKIYIDEFGRAEKLRSASDHDQV